MSTWYEMDMHNQHCTRYVQKVRFICRPNKDSKKLGLQFKESNEFGTENNVQENLLWTEFSGYPRKISPTANQKEFTKQLN